LNDSFADIGKTVQDYDALYYVWRRYDFYTCVLAIVGLAIAIVVVRYLTFSMNLLLTSNRRTVLGYEHRQTTKQVFPKL